MYYDVQKSAERIKKLRIGSNLTQNEAAEQMGFSLSGYRKLERGQNGGECGQSCYGSRLLPYFP